MDTAATLLLVDDEENITNSLRRVLRGKPYRVLTAQDGETALHILQDNEVDLVMSDNRMPGMDGATLLALVEDQWPDTMRIMLTGYADIRAMIKAINYGRIYRYISKPWDDAELCFAIEQALEYQLLTRDRARLQELAHEQNLALKEANATLEIRVRDRTAELMDTASLLATANASLQGSYVTATEVFSSLINQRLPPSRQTNNKVIALVRAFSKACDYPQKLTDDLAMAAALYNIGKLTWTDTLIALPPEKMDRELRERYRDYPRLGESLLMALEPARDAATYIRHHQERWDGAGFPDGLVGESIPLGSRVLKLAVDFVEMQMGMVLARKLTREDVLASMPKYAARLYDPQLCADFVAVVAKIPDGEGPDDDTIFTLHTSALAPGMIMARNLHASSGTLLLKEGSVLTESLIERLHAFQTNEETEYVLYVRRPDPEEEEE